MSRKLFPYFFLAVTSIGLLLTACTSQPAPTPTSTPISILTSTPNPSPTSVPSGTPSPTPVPFTVLTLKPGDFYFSLDGQPGFIFSRNIAGYQPWHYDTFLDWTRDGGSRLARIQLDSLGMGYTSTGGVDLGWQAQWDHVLDKAELDGIYVVPVFSGWFDWNTGSGYSTWKSNPLNQANGGPVKSPAELFQNGSPTQTLWLQWMQALVKHWQARKNILAWEIFSEVNLASGATEATGIDFVNSAASTIRSADPAHRPVTASLADVGTWPNFYSSTAIDYINIHPYPPSAQLDRTIVSEVRNDLAAYKRPVLIGESGLNADSPENYPPNAEVGVRHAIWAAIVSGAMNGRALYWEDSFAIYFSSLGMPFVQKYASLERPAVNFVSGVDFSGFKPLTSTSTGGIWGAAVGNENSVLGWYRDAKCEPPDWTLQGVLTGQSVSLDVLPGSNTRWQVDFYDTKTGTTVLSSEIVTGSGGTLILHLPDFQDDIAFKMTGGK